MAKRAFDIEKKSFEIIDSEVGEHGYDDMQWTVVRRVVHATADFEFATGSGRIIFHPDAVKSAFAAIENRCAVITDVDMVLSAINKKSLADLGLRPLCYISDPSLAEESRKTGRTRSELAMRRATADINGGIVVVGNAPTALYELIRIVQEAAARPALVIGIPVGFVSAPESKADLAKLDIPYITNSGRKGGSPAASSIMNAVMLLYQSKKSSA
ncbi:MAG TPA: precorrin-8X methylmutase [Nitrososphaera sp.]|nr:precorrin-8X methylmutase [Nitrososphaera sp.]